MTNNGTTTNAQDVGRRLVKATAITGFAVVALAIPVTTAVCQLVGHDELQGEWVGENKEGDIEFISFGPNNSFIVRVPGWSAEGSTFVDWDEKPARMDMDWGHGCIHKAILDTGVHGFRFQYEGDGKTRPEKFTDKALVCVRVRDEKLRGEWVCKDSDGHSVHMTFGLMSTVTVQKGEESDEGIYRVDWSKNPAQLDVDLGQRGRTKAIMAITDQGLRMESYDPGNDPPDNFSDDAKAFSRVRASNTTIPMKNQAVNRVTPTTNAIIRSEFFRQVDQVLAKIRAKTKPAGPIPRDGYDDMARGYYDEAVEPLNGIPDSAVPEYVQQARASARFAVMRAVAESDDRAAAYAAVYAKFHQYSWCLELNAGQTNSVRIEDVQVIPVTGADIGRIVRNSGARAVLLKVWATWCTPCRAEFPCLLRLARQYQGQGLKVMLVSADEESEMVVVKKFLAEEGVEFPSYIKAEKDHPFIDGLDKQWTGAIPATFLYDGSGRRQDFWEGGAGIDEERVAKALGH